MYIIYIFRCAYNLYLYTQHYILYVYHLIYNMWIIDKDIYIELQITRLPCSSIFLGSVEIDRIDLFVHMSRVLRKQPIESIGLVYLPTLMVYLFMVFMYLESQVPYF